MFQSKKVGGIYRHVDGLECQRFRLTLWIGNTVLATNPGRHLTTTAALIPYDSLIRDDLWLVLYCTSLDSTVSAHDVRLLAERWIVRRVVAYS